MKVSFDIRMTKPLTKLNVLRHYFKTIESLSPRNTSSARQTPNIVVWAKRKSPILMEQALAL